MGFVVSIKTYIYPFKYPGEA